MNDPRALAIGNVQKYAAKTSRLLPDGASRGEIDQLERDLRLPIPHELRDWLSLHNGPYLGADGIFGILGPDHPHDIRYLRAIHPSWKRTWLPIASDGCGNCYVLVPSAETPTASSVAFIDSQLDDSRCLYAVASSFWHFVSFYLEADLGEERWPLDRDFVLSRDPEIARDPPAPLPWEVDPSLV